MKKCFCLFLFFVTILVANGQERYIKNTYLIGGNFNFFSSKDFGQINFKTTSLFGYFPVKNLALGLNFPFKYDAFCKASQSYYDIGIGPFVRYYFCGKKKIDLFCGVSSSFSKSFSQTKQQTSPFIYSNTKSNTFLFNIGSVFFLNKRIALENCLSYGFINSKHTSSGSPNLTEKRLNTLQYKMGFQIYLHRKEKKE